MADSPPDTYSTLDITTVNDEKLTEYRQEIVNAILNPGIEFEDFDPTLGEAWYRSRLVDVDKELTSRGIGNLGGGLP